MPGEPYNYHQVGNSVSDVGKQFWVTNTFTPCLTVKMLKANWASAVNELDIQMLYMEGVYLTHGPSV